MSPTIDTLSNVFAQNLAVIIGINAYSNGVPALRSAVNDAQRLQDLLQNDHDFTTMLLLDEAATKTRLLNLFTHTLPGHLSVQDRLVVYFAGHGVAMDGDDGPAGYLVPQDADINHPASMLPMQELHRLLDALPCRHLLLILDCCFAGAFRWASNRQLRPLPSILYRERYERFVRDPAWQVLTSAADDQQALDAFRRFAVRQDDGSHSPFALALFEALAGAADLMLSLDGKPPSGDGLITATELSFYLRQRVEEHTIKERNRQTPQLWPLAKHGKGEFIFRVPGRNPVLPSAPELRASNNPYQGLNAFEQKDANLYFGRADLTDDLEHRIAAQPFTVVAGASGTGKSSLVKAGLLTRLAPQTYWHVLPPIRPGAEPLAELCKLDLPGTQADTLTERLIVWRRAHPNSKLLLVIDQFEELITHCHNETERSQFEQQLVAVLADHAEQIRLVITIRSDFEPHFADATSASPLSPHWKNARFAITAMTQDELRLAIVGPSTVRMLNFEPEILVERIINDVVQMPGALPLLSFTLSELYLRYLQHADDTRSLTSRDYDELGGVSGSLSQRASQEYDRLPDEAHQMTMQRVLLRMVAVEGGELARRRVPITELIYADTTENDRVKLVIQRLVAARLLVLDTIYEDSKLTREVYIEPAHDTLIRAWDKLLIWKRAAGEDLPLQRRLTQAATEWERADARAKIGLLWTNNPRLGRVQQMVSGKNLETGESTSFLTSLRNTLWPITTTNTQSTWLNRIESEFVRQSILHRAKVLWRIIGITMTIILILGGLTIISEINRREAGIQRNQAIIASSERATEVIVRTTAEANAISEANARATEVVIRATAEAAAKENEVRANDEARISKARELAAVSENISERNPTLRPLLAVEAVNTTKRVDGTVLSEAELALYHALAQSPFRKEMPGHEGWIFSVIFDVTGQLVLTNQAYGPARLWDSDGNFIRLIEATKGYVSANFSPDGQLILTAEDLGNVRIWDRAGELKLTIESHDYMAHAVTMNLSQTHILTVGCDDDIFVDCKGSARLWDSQGQLLATLKHEGADVTSAIFSPNGELILTADENGIAYTWDLDGNRLQQYEANTSWVSSQSFHPDGSRFVTGACGVYNDGIGPDTSQWHPYLPCYFEPQIRLWDMDGNLLRTLDGGGYSALFSPDGHYLLTTDAEQGYLWTSDGELVRTFNSGGLAVFNSNGTKILIAGTDGVVYLWSVAGELLNTFEGDTSVVLAATFDPSGSRILTAVCDGPRQGACLEGARVRMWSTNGIDAIRAQESSIPVEQIVFNQTGARVATRSDDGIVRLWDAERKFREITAFTGYTNTKQIVGINLHGTRIAIVYEDGVVRIWDEEGKVVQELERFVDSSVLNNAGNAAPYIFTEDAQDHSVHLWDINGELLASYVGHTTQVNYANLSQMGDQVITIGSNNDVHLWDRQGKIVWQLLGNDAWFSPTGRHFVTIPVDDGQQLIQINERQLLSPTFKADNTYGNFEEIIFNATGKYILWPEFSGNGLWITDENGDNARYVDAITQGGTMPISSPDGKVFLLQICSIKFSVNVCELDTLSMWNITGELLGTIGGINSEESALFSPSNNHILIYSKDGEAQLWQSNRTLLTTLPTTLAPVTAAEFSPDGKKLIIAQANGSLKLWDIWTDIDTMLAVATQRAGRIFSQEECTQYFNSPCSDALFTQAIAWALAHEDGLFTKQLCRAGSLANLAKQMLPVCEHSVHLLPEDADALDWRAITRAFVGDYAGAIEDFTAVNSMLAPVDEQLTLARIQWITALQAGQNPLTIEVLQQAISDRIVW